MSGSLPTSPTPQVTIDETHFQATPPPAKGDTEVRRATYPTQLAKMEVALPDFEHYLENYSKKKSSTHKSLVQGAWSV